MLLFVGSKRHRQNFMTEKQQMAKYIFPFLIGSFILLMLNFQVLYILPTKVHFVKAMVFRVVLYRCESWTVKKAES